MKFYSAIFLIFSNLVAQGGTVSGKVTDSTNDSPLIGANVILEGTSLGAATDGEGRYEIIGLAAGEYVITVSYIGFRNFKENISLESGQRITKDLVLQPEYTTLQIAQYLELPDEKRVVDFARKNTSQNFIGRSKKMELSQHKKILEVIEPTLQSWGYTKPFYQHCM